MNTTSNRKYLLILGNGFDLDLGLKSSYGEFIQSEIFKDMQNNAPVGEHLLKDLSNEFELQKWIDLEKWLKGHCTPDPSGFEYDDEPINTCRLLTNALQKYINDCKPKEEGLENTYAYRVLEAVVKNEYFDIITFNYTNPFYLTGIGNSDTDITHIHGACGSETIILGFDDDRNVEAKYTELVKTCNSNYISNSVAYDIEEAEVIIFFGHSLGETDYFYFSELFSSLSAHSASKRRNREIHIFTYDDKSRTEILKQLRVMNNYRTGEMMTRNKIVFYKTIDNGDESKLKSLFEKIEEIHAFEKTQNAYLGEHFVVG